MKDSHEFFVTREAIYSLTEKLTLPEVNKNSQDWELEYADETRVSEFVSYYYDDNDNLTLNEKFALMCLIIASYDDALSAGIVQEGIEEKIKGLLIKDIDLHRQTILYWSLVDTEIEGIFSVTPLMREIINEKKLELI